MNREDQTSAIDDGPLEAALADYFGRIDRGEPMDVTEFVARHPGDEAKLRRFLEVDRALRNAVAVVPMVAVPNENLSRRTLGDFRLRRELGRGGMGTVFEAEQVSMGRRVALKVLPFAAVVNEKALQRFRNEVRAAASLDHPHIVSVYSIGEEHGIHFYAMQLIRGQTLADVISQLRKSRKAPSPRPRGMVTGTAGDDALKTDPSNLVLPSTHADNEARISTAADSRHSIEHYRSAARMGIQAAEALQHAHDQGVLHRDIKPSNLMLDAQGKLYITDFGLARIEADAGMTMTGDIVGTLRYMAPEQALAKRVVIDSRADVYSLGATLYELLTVQPVFGETDRAELLKQIAFEEPLPLRKHDRHIPVEMETVVLKAIAKSPDDRYQSAQGLADDLRAYLECRPIKAKPPTLVDRAAKWSRRHVVVVWSAAALLCACMIILLASNVRIRRESAAKEIALAEKEVALATARKAVDQMLVRASESELRDVPSAESIRVALLEDALKFYERLAGQGTADPRIGRELVAILSTVCGIQRALGRFEDALKTGERAIRTSEEFAAANPHDSTWLLGVAIIEQCHAYNWSVTPPGPNIKQVEEHYRRALAIFAELERKWPDEPVPTAMCMRYLAKSALQQGDDAEAVRLLRRGIEQNEKYLAYAETRFPKIEMGEEVSYGDVVAAHTATIGNARVDVCWACAELRDVLDGQADSEELLRKGLYHANILYEENPRSESICEVRAYLTRHLAEALANTGQIDESVKLFETLVETVDDSSSRILRLQVLNKAAGGFWKVGKWNSAVSLAEEALELARKHDLKHAALGRIYYILANISLSRGQAETAESWARKSIEAFDYPGESYGSPAYANLLLGEALRQRGKLDDAIAMFAESWKMHDSPGSDPNPAFAKLLTCARRSGDPQLLADTAHNAIEYLESKYGRTSMDGRHLAWRAAAYAQLGEWDQAQIDLQDAEKKGANWDDFQVATFLETLLEAAPPSDSAAADSLSSLQRFVHRWLDLASNENVNRLNEMAWSLAVDHKTRPELAKIAVQLAKKAAEIQPDDGNIENTLGTAYYRAGEWQASIDVLGRARSHNGNKGVAHDGYILAMAHARQGDIDSAKRWFRLSDRWSSDFAIGNAELQRFRAEAAELLGMKVEPLRPTLDQTRRSTALE